MILVLLAISTLSLIHIPAPVHSPEITSAYGHREALHLPHGGMSKPIHEGLDIIGLPQVRSVLSGTVIEHYPYYSWTAPHTYKGHPVYGGYIIIQHKPALCSHYAHLQVDSTLHINEGMQIEQGQPIGKMGNTGYSTGAHLHFAISNCTKTGTDYNYLPIFYRRQK